MNKRNTKKYYFLGVVFLLAGVIFLACGLWNVAGALSTDFFIYRAVVALIFLLLFAAVAITYGIFLFKSARKDAGSGSGESSIDRVSPASVTTLLAFGLAPLLFVYLSGQSRELNTERQAAFQEIRPAFLLYIADHGKIPGDLQQLVPEYLAVLPDAVLLNDAVGLDRRVRYRPERNTALFYYKTGGITAGETCYDIVDDRYRQTR
jgi:hypothetical protein